MDDLYGHSSYKEREPYVNRGNYASNPRSKKRRNANVKRGMFNNRSKKGCSSSKPLLNNGQAVVVEVGEV